MILFTLIVFAAPCFAFYMVEVVRWQYWFTDIGKNNKFTGPLLRKPFTCTVCLSAWAGLTFALLYGAAWYSIPLMFISGIAGLILEGLIKKYL